MDKDKLKDFNDVEEQNELDDVIQPKDGLIKEINKKVYIKDNSGKKKQLLKEVRYQF